MARLHLSGHHHSQPTAFIFDLDGTLAETHHDIAASTDHMLSSMGLAPIGPEAIPRYIGRGIEHLLGQVMGINDDEAVRRGLKLYSDHHVVHCTDHARLYDGAAEILSAIKSRGLATGLLSNKPKMFCDLVLKKLGIFESFDIIFGADSTPWPKPSGRGLSALLDLLGLGGADAVYIGDSSIDIATARAASTTARLVRAGFVKGGYGVIEDDAPDYVWESLLNMKKEFGL